MEIVGIGFQPPVKSIKSSRSHSTSTEVISNVAGYASIFDLVKVIYS